MLKPLFLTHIVKTNVSFDLQVCARFGVFVVILPMATVTFTFFGQVRKRFARRLHPCWPRRVLACSARTKRHAWQSAFAP